MAKPQVTLTLAGDSSQLEKTFERVGSSSREMSGEVSQASRTVGNSSTSFDRAAEGADRFDTKAMGFRDTMTGVQDSMMGVSAIAKGNLFEGFFLLGMGVGDLASGFANFLIPQMKSFTKTAIANSVATVRGTATMAAHRAATFASAAATRVMTVAQRGLNFALRANPIGIVITVLAALVAGIVVAYRRSETFRNIVQAAMRRVRAAFGWVIDRGRQLVGWFSNLPARIGRFMAGVIIRGQNLVGWFSRLPGRIAGFFRGIGSIIAAPFHAAFSGIRSAWNATIGGRGFSVPGWVPGIGGRSFTIPTLHQGGVVPGAPGSEVLTRLQAGERVSPIGAGAGGQVRLVIDVTGGDDDLKRMIRRMVRVDGRGDVQVAFG